MDSTTLRETFHLFVARERIEELATLLRVMERDRKRDLVALVWALVLGAGSDDSGRLADVYSSYLKEADDEVVRGSFYAWFTEKQAVLLAALTFEAMAKVRSQPPQLSGELAGVEDWILVDSETVTLPDAFAELFPATSTAAGLKIHKHYSLGRNNIVDFEITPARDHDAPQLQLDESWRGLGLIVDLGYVSHHLIRECERFGVKLVIRLKAGWKPRLLRIWGDDDEHIEIEGEPVLANLLEADPDDFLGFEVDYDVAFGRGSQRVTARLVGIPADDGYHWCITTLPRATHPPRLVGQLYRCRWEIECDNRRDKGGSRLDQIRVSTVPSLMALIHASLLRSILANHIVYVDLRDRPNTRPPLHGFAVSLAMASNHEGLLMALATDAPLHRWEKLARVIRRRGHDPNWRRRPSVLDQLRGTTAPPGRAKHRRLRDCGPESQPYSQRAA
jgi:putative transposase